MSLFTHTHDVLKQFDDDFFFFLAEHKSAVLFHAQAIYIDHVRK